MTPKMKEALKKTVERLNALSDEELDALLEKAENGPLAQTLQDLSNFRDYLEEKQ